MEIKVLGCYGPYPANNGATAGYLFRTKDSTIQLDMGSGVFARMSKEVKPEDVSAIILSHLHFDHMSDMGVYNYYLEILARSGKLKGNVNCYIPPVSEEEMENICAQYPYFDFIRVKENSLYKIGNAEVSFYKMKHGVLDMGTMIYEEEKRFAYTGDTNVCDNLEKLTKNSDFMLVSAPFISEKDYNPNGGHLSCPIVCAFSKKYNRKIIVSHLIPDYDRKAYEEACTTEKVQIAKEFETYFI